jgi:hypothetical protein
MAFCGLVNNLFTFAGSDPYFINFSYLLGEGSLHNYTAMLLNVVCKYLL